MNALRDIGELCAQVGPVDEVRIGPCRMPEPPDYAEPDVDNAVLVVVVKGEVAAEAIFLERWRSTPMLWRSTGTRLALELARQRVRRMVDAPIRAP